MSHRWSLEEETLLKTIWPEMNGDTLLISQTYFQNPQPKKKIHYRSADAVYCKARLLRLPAPKKVPNKKVIILIKFLNLTYINIFPGKA